MAVKKILVTSNAIQRQVTYRKGSTTIAGGDRGGVCRTMVLTWIRQSHLGVRMNDMGKILTGGGFASISILHESTKFRMRAAGANEARKEAIADDILYSFSLRREGDALDFQTAMIGMTLEPEDIDTSATTASYAMLTLISNSGGHALGLAFNERGYHYMLDPNSGLYEYNDVDSMLGLLGHLTSHVINNYAQRYPASSLEQFEKLAG